MILEGFLEFEPLHSKWLTACSCENKWDDIPAKHVQHLYLRYAGFMRSHSKLQSTSLWGPCSKRSIKWEIQICSSCRCRCLARLWELSAAKVQWLGPWLQDSQRGWRDLRDLEKKNWWTLGLWTNSFALRFLFSLYFGPGCSLQSQILDSKVLDLQVAFVAELSNDLNWVFICCLDAVEVNFSSSGENTSAFEVI